MDKVYANSQTGVRYEGGWKDSKREGKGTVTTPDGKKYVGDFLNDFGAGEVECTVCGSVYKGQWSKSRKHGKGTLTTPEGNQ
ncbi:hypothetical protein AGMMS49949_02660 [Alphaproteobacteria bacterium]|nr:hypothetical protein AGMMS49949_02660 [Alphaproteobacteria bacterium]GHS96012.1 hypothetical protein AGMMS50296_1670 [Alphaproteobacteria bacterium]